MFAKLLIPLDGTPEAAVALPPARALAKATGAELLLCRVVPERSPRGDDVEIVESQTYLDRVAEELRGDQIQVDTVTLTGDVPRALLREASARSVDLIIMATHGRSGLERAIMGSVTERVVADSTVPVMLLRPGGHRLTHVKTLLVPVDGTPGGSVALGVALGLARVIGAKIVLLRVVEPIPAHLYDGIYWSGGAYLDPAWDEESRQAAQSFVNGMALRLRKAGAAAEGRAIIGDVTTTIVETAEAVEADVIVMSTHALTGPARAILGSVSDAVVRTARRPVLLIRRSAPMQGPTGQEAPAAASVAGARPSREPSEPNGEPEH